MNLLATERGRRCLFALLYLCEGAPIGFLWWTLNTILREQGVPRPEIGALLGALALPWALKFVWAPAVDVARSPRFGFRGWIASSQLVMAATLVPLFWIGITPAAMPWITALLLVHACAAATQDVAIDGLAIRSTTEGERGRLSGWMQLGMLSGRAIFGGGALQVRSQLGDGPVLGGLLCLLVAGLGLHLLYRSPEPANPTAAAARGETLRSFLRHLRRAARRRATWQVLLFAATAGTCFEAVGAMVPSLLVDRGVDTATIGWFALLPVNACLAVGALAGGSLADRWGQRRTIVVSSLAVSVCAVVAAALAGPDGGGPGHGSLLVALAGVYLAAGLLTASSYALFMAHTDPRLGATQLSAYMAGTNLCESVSATVAGTMTERHGYDGAFAVLAAVAPLALILLLRLPRPDHDSPDGELRT